MPSISELQDRIRKATDIKQLADEVANILRGGFETGKRIHVEDGDVRGDFPVTNFLSEHYELLKKLRFADRVDGPQYEHGFAHYLNDNAKRFYEQLKQERYYPKAQEPLSIEDKVLDWFEGRTDQLKVR